ncbi:FLS2, partial [Symbiodinium sp. CCMP2456]
ASCCNQSVHQAPGSSKILAMLPTVMLRYFKLMLLCLLREGSVFGSRTEVVTELANETEIHADPQPALCAEKTALWHGECVDCKSRHLLCSTKGSVAADAQPEPGYAKLSAGDARAYRCLPPAKRCEPDLTKPNASSTGLGCAIGYTVPLCVACDVDYFASGTQCKHCAKASQSAAVRWAPALLAMLLVFAGAAYYCWRSRMDINADVNSLDVKPKQSAAGVLRQLIVLQAPLLLQLVQLWSLLGGLEPEVVGNKELTTATSWRGPWELAYVKTLLLSAQDLQGIVNIQCYGDGTFIRSMTAIISPMIPLFLLLCCAVVELFRPSIGVALSLKLLSLLFIGGASSCYRLTACQFVDGEDRNLDTQAFYTVFPHLKCYMGTEEDVKQKGMISTVFWLTAFAYNFLIPCFLLRVMARQHVALQDTRLFVACSASDRGNTQILRLQPLGILPPLEKDDGADRHLLAAAVAHMVVYMHGPVKVELVQDAVHVTPLEDAQPATLESHDLGTLLASRLVPKHKLDVQRARNIQQMLSERGVLETTSDPLLIGAKTLLSKYALGGKVWMEVAVKLASVNLAAVISGDFGFHLAVISTLCMSGVILVLSPYASPQLNILHSFCFLCLTLGAVGFLTQQVLLSRLALVAPFVLCLCQARQPDSLESLALRIYEEMAGKLAELRDGKPLQASVEILKC